MFWQQTVYIARTNVGYGIKKHYYGEYTAFYNAGICSQEGIQGSEVTDTQPSFLHASGTVDTENLAVDPLAVL